MLKRNWGVIVFIVLLGLLAFTNPSKKDFVSFFEKEYGKLPKTDLPVGLEKINFLFFSLYTPVVATEHGITHLGILGHFVQISEGQFDYHL